jgi:hypothetical protein
MIHASKLCMKLRNQGIVVVCIVLAVAALVSSCGNKNPRGTNLSSATVVPVALERTLPPLPVRQLSPKMLAMRERTMRVASSLRELEWTGEVGMTELSGWEYGTRAREMAKVLGGEELNALGHLGAASGVLPEGTDLEALAASFTAASAGATYSPLDKQILLVDKFKGDSLVTHEFVHALQDQHFDLLKLLVVRPYNFDRAEALFAVIEGDAMNVQRRAEEGDGYARKPLEDITRQEEARFGAYREDVGALFPPLLTETFIFRYRDGARFVEAVRRSRGERGVNELFERPPVSSEQILHPEKYVQGETPREVALDETAFARDGWKLSASTPLGEIGVRGLLMAGIALKDAVRAAAGWNGDRAFLFEREGSAPLFVWKTAWDKRSDAEEFFNAYNAPRQHQGAQAISTSINGDKAQAIWQQGGRVTLVQRDSDSVIVLRGVEADVNAALEWVRL